jgi:hypothetical protein
VEQTKSQHTRTHIYQINNQQKRTYKTLELSLSGTKSKEEQPAKHIQQTEKAIQTRQAMHVQRNINARSYNHCCCGK